MSVKPTDQTIILPAGTEAELKAVAEFETALKRQIGWQPKLELWKDDKGKVWAVAGWRMTRQEQAAVAMFQRRGAKPKDDKGKPTKALIAAKDVEKKKVADVTAEKKLTKDPVAITPGIEPQPKQK